MFIKIQPILTTITYKRMQNWFIGITFLKYLFYVVPFSTIKALKPFLATVEVVSYKTNIWFPGTEILVLLKVPVIFLINSEFSLPPSKIFK